jgi:lipopolysaccharide export system permease protein
MFAAGVDKRALVRPTMIVAGVVLVVVMVLNAYLTPLALRTFKDAVFEIRSNYASVLIQEGEFNTPVDGLTVYVRTRQPGGELEGILVHDNRDQQKPVTMLAERGALVRGPDGPRFLLVNGNRQEVERETGTLSLLYFDRYTIDLARFAAPQGERWIEPSERFLSELFSPALSADDQRNIDRLRVEGHRRLTSPFYAIAFAAIGLAGAVGGQFSRRGQGMRILATGAVGVVFRLAEIGLASIATTYPALTPLLYLNVIAGTGIALWVLFRQPGRAPLPHAEPEAA